MKKASEVMYRIANFFIWILILLLIAAIVIAVLQMVGIIPIKSGTQGGLALLIPSIVFLIIEFIVLALSRHAANDARDGNKRAGPHVLMLIMGIISGNVFFFLGSIFGLVSLR